MAVKPYAPQPINPRRIHGTHFCLRLSRSHGHDAAGRIRSLEKSIDVIGSWTRDIPACSIVPQPSTLPHVPSRYATASPHYPTALSGTFIKGGDAFQAHYLSNYFNQLCYKEYITHNSGYYPSSWLLFKTQRFVDWVLCPPSGGTYSVGRNR
jgi:hypothetical protein